MAGVKGKGGPKPLPTAIMLARRSRMLGRRQAEPHPPPQVPPCPAWVSQEARKHWKEIASIVEGMQVMTAADRVALGLLVDALARYLAVKKAVYGSKDTPGSGLITAHATGTLARHPNAVLLHDAWEQTLKACREFGLTPSSRTTVRMRSVPGATNAHHEAEDTKTSLFRA